MARPSARLVLGAPRRLRKPEKHLVAIEAWAESFRGVWPAMDGHRPHAHWHLPADQRLVDPPWADRTHQVRAVAALLAAAAHLRAARPPECDHQVIYIVLHWPALFMAEVGIFLDPAYAATFERRSDPSQTWTHLQPERSLAERLQIALPDGFAEYGYWERHVGDNHVHEGEVWVMREPLPKIAT